MNIEETYNIHKIINCIFPFFKSKAMCKKGIHNYRINPRTNFKCFCCGKEIDKEH